MKYIFVMDFPKIEQINDTPAIMSTRYPPDQKK